MLVLSRGVDEKIMIGDNITITIVDIRGGKVRLGFDAPREIPVHREEVFKAIKEAEEKQRQSCLIGRQSIFAN
jgi:carbon storage regulator